MTRTAPDQSVWWDVPTVKAAALAILRLGDGDVDAGRVEALVPVAGGRINDRLDRADPIVIGSVPAVLTDAIVAVTVELYRRKDAPPSSIEGAMLGAWRPPATDPTAGVSAQILPYRQRFGIG